MSNKLLIIGISGVTCGGKTTLAQKLNTSLTKSALISQDDYFLEVDDPRHVWIPQLEHINFDILSSLDMEKMYEDIQNFIKNRELIEMKKQTTIHTENNSDLDALCDKINKSGVEILIIEGFCIFNYKPLRNIFHLKYYLTLSKEECYQRRIQRVYEPPDCPGYFEGCVWLEHLNQLKEIQEEVADVKYIEGVSNTIFNGVVKDINVVLNL